MLSKLMAVKSVSSEAIQGLTRALTPLEPSALLNLSSVSGILTQNGDQALSGFGTDSQKFHYMLESTDMKTTWNKHRSSGSNIECAYRSLGYFELQSWM